MAIYRASFYSSKLMRTVPFMALIPNDGPIFPGQEPSFTTGKMKSLYLLHGAMGDETDWLVNTNIRALSNQYKLAVFMPEGSNSFYVDAEYGAMSDYGKYIGEELVDYTRLTFKLSQKREDTYIGGLSMGGYGAIRNALKYPERFSKVFAFSGAYIPYRIVDAKGKPIDDPISGPAFFKRTFGNLAELESTDMYPDQMIRNLDKSGRKPPDIFLTCGTEDHLLDLTRRLRDQMLKVGWNVTYSEDKGGHEWTFWQKQLEGAIQWLVKKQNLNS